MSERSSSFELTGRAVTHTARPRFRAVFEPGDSREPAETHGSGGAVRCGAVTSCGGGPFRAARVDWLDEPPADAKIVSRLMREAADHLHDHWAEDWVQEAVAARAGELGLSAYAIAKATGGAVSEDHVLAYMSRRKSMGSHKLQHVLRALGLTVGGAT